MTSQSHVFGRYKLQREIQGMEGALQLRTLAPGEDLGLFSSDHRLTHNYLSLQFLETGHSLPALSGGTRHTHSSTHTHMQANTQAYFRKAEERGKDHTDDPRHLHC